MTGFNEPCIIYLCPDEAIIFSKAHIQIFFLHNEDKVAYISKIIWKML